MGFLCVWLSSCASFGTSAKSYVYRQVHMGMEVRMTLVTPDESLARRAGSAAFALVGALEARLSDYRDDSDLRAIERAAPQALRLEPDVFVVIQHALRVASASGGAFDPTVAPVVALWRQARTSRRLPSTEELAAARRLVGWSRVELDESTHTVRLPERGMRLDLGGIAKGFILQRALAAIQNAGVPAALLEAGGDIVGYGAVAWKAHVSAQCTVLSAINTSAGTAGALSTSGATAQFVEIGGTRYSHVVDPKTGLGLTDQRTVHVRAPDGATADAWSTALGVVGPQVAATLPLPPGVSYCFAR